MHPQRRPVQIVSFATGRVWRPRAHERIETRLDGLLEDTATGCEMPCVVHNVSNGGMMVVLGRGFRVPTHVVIRIPEQNFAARARTVWVKGQQLGLAFEGPPDSC
jgi:hypothetical protein